MNRLETKQEKNEKTVDDLICLCACAVNNRVPEKKRVEEMDFADLYRVAEEHMLTAVAAYALESADIHDQKFTQAKALAVRRMAIMDHEMEKVLEQLETAGIWYMPLKGAVLKDCYPAYGLRQMSDRDILVDPARTEDVRRIMENLGFMTDHFGEFHHDCYFKPPVSSFEMHHALFEAMQGECVTGYYADVKNRLLKDEDNAFGWHFSPEDFYIHLVLHEYKHYSTNGTGLRSLLDTYVYLKNVKYDEEYVISELKKLGAAEFEQANRELALHLFDGEALTETERQMLKRFAVSGVFGSSDLYAVNQLSEKGRRGYFLSRMSLPYDRMLELYPVLKKTPMLYPLCWTHRLVHAFIFKNRVFMQQLKAGLTWKEKE